MKTHAQILGYACIALTLSLIHKANAEQEPVRLWKHINGTSIAGALKEFKNEEAVIIHGDREVRVKLHDLSVDDRAYLLKVDFPPASTQVKESNSSENNVNIGSEKDNNNANPKSGLAKKWPKGMLDLVTVLNSFSGKYLEAQNELQKSALRTERQAELRKQFVDRQVVNWVASIADMRTDSNRDALLILALDDTKFTLPKSRPISISVSNTMFPVKHGSDLYNRLASFKRGAVVFFSGEFIESQADYLKENSITERGSMISPEFDFRFSDISIAE